VNELKPHIISINETWVKQDQKGEFNKLFDYVFISNCRNQTKGGGVALYVHKTLSFTIRDSFTIMNKKLFESPFIDIFINKRDKMTISAIYRSPNQSTQANSEFVKTLCPLVNNISKSKLPTIITGDFNYNLLEYQNTHTNNFIDLMFDHSFFSCITKPTRITPTTVTVLNQIWINIFNKRTGSGIIVDCIADHLPVAFCVELDDSLPFVTRVTL